MTVDWLSKKGEDKREIMRGEREKRAAFNTRKCGKSKCGLVLSDSLSLSLKYNRFVLSAEVLYL